MKRRQFIKFLSVATGGILASKGNALFAKPLTFEKSLFSAESEQKFWQVVREQFVFPEDYIYLNTGGIGATPAVVMHAVRASDNEQQLHPSPGYNHDNWQLVKKKAAKLINASSEEEIALVSTATEGINIVLNGLPLKKGDEIITSTHEHAALHVPLLNNMQRYGIVPRFFEPEFKNGMTNVDKIEKLINKRTRLIFLSHVTCTTGQIFPVKEIGELAREKKLWYALDGAQAVGNIPVDVQDIGVDFYAFSGHKWVLGPKRTGIFYVRKDLLDTLRPTVVGAYSDGGFNVKTREFKLNPTAQRYEYATENEALFVGLSKAMDFINTIGIGRIHKHNRSLAEMFYGKLTEMENIKIASPQEEIYRSGIISFKIKNKDFHEVAGKLGKKQFRVRVVPEAELNGIRISFHVYNNETHVEMLVKELDKIVNG